MEHLDEGQRNISPVTGFHKSDSQIKLVSFLPGFQIRSSQMKKNLLSDHGLLFLQGPEGLLGPDAKPNGYIFLTEMQNKPTYPVMYVNLFRRNPIYR